MNKLGQVLGWKFNHQEGMEIQGDIITAFPGPIPSQADIDAWTQEYNDFVRMNEYKGTRKGKYPSYGDQLDMLYHDIVNNTLEGGEWVKTIKGVKEKYPKP